MKLQLGSNASLDTFYWRPYHKVAQLLCNHDGEETKIECKSKCSLSKGEDGNYVLPLRQPFYCACF